MLPFKSGRIVMGKDFCGRQQELARLREYLQSCNRMENAGLARRLLRRPGSRCCRLCAAQ